MEHGSALGADGEGIGVIMKGVGVVVKGVSVVLAGTLVLFSFVHLSIYIWDRSAGRHRLINIDIAGSWRRSLLSFALFAFLEPRMVQHGPGSNMGTLFSVLRSHGVVICLEMINKSNELIVNMNGKLNWWWYTQDPDAQVTQKDKKMLLFHLTAKRRKPNNQRSNAPPFTLL